MRYQITIIETVSYNFGVVSANSKEEAKVMTNMLLDEYNEGSIMGTPREGDREDIYAKVEEQIAEERNQDK